MADKSPAEWTPEGKTATELLAHAMGDTLHPEDYYKLLPHVAQALTDCGCTAGDHADRRIAMWLAQAGVESGVGQTMTEGGSRAYFTKLYENRKDLGNTYPGDGARFRGRGAVQTTGRLAYTRFSKWAHQHYPDLVPSDTFFAPPPPARAKGMTEAQWLALPLPPGFDKDPELLADPKYAWLVAVWEWTVEDHFHTYRTRVWRLKDRKGHKKPVPPGTPGAVLETVPGSVRVNFNALADAGDIAGATAALNGNGPWPKDKRGIPLPIPIYPERQYSLPAAEKQSHFTWRTEIYKRCLAMGPEALRHIADPSAAAREGPPAKKAPAKRAKATKEQNPGPAAMTLPAAQSHPNDPGTRISDSGKHTGDEFQTLSYVVPAGKQTGDEFQPASFEEPAGKHTGGEFQPASFEEPIPFHRPPAPPPTHTENVVGNLRTPGDQGQGGGPYGTMPTHTENVVGNLRTPDDQEQGGGPYGTMPTHTENVVGNLRTPDDQEQGGGPYGTMPTHTENVVGNLRTPDDQEQGGGPYGTMPTHTENVVGNLRTPDDQEQGGGPYGTMPTHTENVVGNLRTPDDQEQGGGPYGTMPTHTENVVGNLRTPDDQEQGGGPMLHATPQPPDTSDGYVSRFTPEWQQPTDPAPPTTADQGQNAGPVLHAAPQPPAPPDSGPTPDQGPDLAPKDAYGRVLPTAPAGPKR